MEKIVLGLSGGVDSAVCARLLQNMGYEVHGLYLDIGTEAARNDAVMTAEFLGVSLKIQDISAELEEHVCRPFTGCYRRGETPNPCVLCNPAVKFRALCDYADSIGAEKIATGHYARVVDGQLCRAHSGNDQSYMLNRLKREQAARLILPLGEFEKSHVRELAEGFGIPVAHKPDSMEICFIPDKDYIGWLSRRDDWETPKSGEMLWNGVPVLAHEGIHRWTVGQRIPGVFGEKRDTKLYVKAIDPESGNIEVCENTGLLSTQFVAHSFNWLIDAPTEPLRGSVKVRHTKSDEPSCTATYDPDSGEVRFALDSPVRAPARGQSAVFYDGDRVLGGGFIK